ncbi:hypothetical protein [Embleya sp. NPDC059237]|uniref:hypothetical protein n=1 Tax=Embleya sp. NPDC059237 TaxID=3346784 RepID=UPI0036878B70
MNGPPLDSHSIQRLAFIRHLYEQGVEQASRPEALSATAILSFHDAVELFVKLAADHLGVNMKTKAALAEYWTELDRVLAPDVLPSKNAMGRLNTMRNSLKHDGTHPSPRAIPQVQADVTTFLTDACSLALDVDFASVDLSDLVQRPETVAHLAEAGGYADAGDLPAAMATLLAAVEELVWHYTRWRPAGQSPFWFGPTLPLPGPARVPRSTGRGYDMVQPTHREYGQAQATLELQNAMRLMSLGIDYRRFARLRFLAPRLERGTEGQIYFDAGRVVPGQLNFQDYQFGRLFVIEAAIQAAQSDALLMRMDADEQGERETWSPPRWQYLKGEPSPGGFVRRLAPESE